MNCASCLDLIEVDQLRTMVCGCIRCYACIAALDNFCPLCGLSDDLSQSDNSDSDIVDAKLQLSRVQSKLREELDHTINTKEFLEDQLNSKLRMLESQMNSFRRQIILDYDKEFTTLAVNEKELESRIESASIHANLEVTPKGEGAFLTDFLIRERKTIKRPQVKLNSYRFKMETDTSFVIICKRNEARKPGLMYIITQYDRLYYWEVRGKVNRLMLDDIMVFESSKSIGKVRYHSSTEDCDYFVGKSRRGEEQVYFVKDFEWCGPFPRNSLKNRQCIKNYIPASDREGELTTMLSLVKYNETEFQFI
jgi:hypothetical protein